MEDENKKIKYFIYARKSTESEDKQMASIESQILELKKISDQYNLEIVHTFQESMSAKAPGRPIFADMIQRIHKGEANGILCWKLNRLARNPIDGGQISWMLQQGSIHHIQTFGRSYYPSDNVIVMAVELGMANQFIRDLRVDTMRGLRNKAERGWYPAHATLGYIDNPLRRKGQKEIIPDPERFELARKMFDLMLKGAYTPPKIVEIATKEWGLRNREGGKVARSTIYRIFSDPFYYGKYEYPKRSEIWYKGEHQPMITRQEFDKIQALLGKKGNTRVSKHDFAFRGPIICGECSGSVTAESKIKRQKNGVVRFYTYYHCTKRVNPDCSQGCIEEKELEKQIKQELENISIPESLRLWAIDTIKGQNEEELKDRNQIIDNLRSEYDRTVKMIDSLIDMRINKEISEEDLKRKKEPLIKEKDRLQELLNDTNGRITEWSDIADKYMSIAEKAKINFEKGTIDEKRIVLRNLGSNLYLKDKKLNICLSKPLIDIKSVAKEAWEINNRLEPLQYGLDKKKIGQNYAQCFSMLRG